MAELQGLATFPGIPHITGATFVIQHGISPSVCVIKTVPQPTYVAPVGVLVFTFGNLKLQFPESAVDKASLRFDKVGQRWSLRIFDRRWKWRFGSVTGRYNVRKVDGKIDEDTEKTPQELALLLLKEMGDGNADVSRMPNKSRPAVSWDFINPAQQLAALCDQLSCRIVLDTGNTITIYRIGQGKDLPENGLEVNAGFGFDTKLRPARVVVVGGKARFQSKLRLEAVGEEPDGEIKKIDDLSYKPENGWAAFNAAANVAGNVTGTFTRDGKTTPLRSLALRTVFKYYRVISQENGKLDVPGFADKIESVDQYTLESVQVLTSKDPDGKEKAIIAYVDGGFAVGEAGAPIANVEDGTVWDQGFRIDSARGLVIFNTACFKLDDDNKNIEAEVFLTTAYTVEDTETRTPVRHVVHLGVPGSIGERRVGDRLLQHPEIVRTVRQTYKDGTVRDKLIDNRAAVDREARHYLDAAVKEYDRGESSTREYAGLVSIDPDGKIQQVGWTVGSGGAMTRASQNDEFSIFVPSFRERRRQEKVEALDDFIAELRAGGATFVGEEDI